MVKLKTAHYINTGDVKEITGKHWLDFEFAQTARNDSFQVLYCDDWYLEELYKALERESGKKDINLEDFKDEEEYDRHCRYCRALRLKNQIELIEILRKDYGIRDSILIWISW